MNLTLEKDLKDYTKQQLLTLLKTHSAKDLVATKRTIKDRAHLYNYLCKIVNTKADTEMYEGLKYKILYKKDLDQIFTDPFLREFLNQFRQKCPMLVESDPLVLSHKARYKNDNSKAIVKGDLFCFYRDYEKNVPCYLHFRVLK